MCRLAFFPKGTDVKVPRVGKLLEELDKLLGGDGVGVATWSPKQQVEVIKGVKITGKTAGKILARKGNENGWLYHARARSAGDVTDHLNQPFNTKDYLFVHNGHYGEWRTLHFALMMMKRVSPDSYMNDSRSIAEFVQAAENPDVLGYLPHGVFISWKRGDQWPYAYVQGGDFAYSSLPEDEGGGLVYASTFPADWPMTAYEFQKETKVELRGDGPPRIMWGEAPKKLYAFARGRGGTCGFRNGALIN